jgi:hypothetical protein
MPLPLWTFIAGLAVGAYLSNKTFRDKLNAGIKKLLSSNKKKEGKK